MTTPWRLLVGLLLTTFTFVALHLCALPEAAAQEPEPIRLIFVNTAKKGGERAYKTVNNILKKSDDVTLGDEGKFWLEAEALGLSEKTFRNTEQRNARTKKIRRLMRTLEIEAVIVLDVYSRGRKAQLVFLGPRGEEIANVRRNVRRGRIKNRMAVGMLKEGFEPMIPLIKEWREVKDQEPEEEEEVADLNLMGDDGEETGEDDGGDEELSAKERVLARQRAENGQVQTGFGIGAGALVGRRSLVVQTEGDYSLEHTSPFVGVFAQLRGVLMTFSGGSSGLGVELGGGYAPFTTIFSPPGQEQLDLASQFSRIGGKMLLLTTFNDSFGLEGWAGAELLTITVAPNSYYTGSSYTYLDAGAALQIKFVDQATLSLGGGVLPILSADTSAGAYGPGDFALGFEGVAGLDVAFTDNLTLGLDYQLLYLPPAYPDPVLIVAPATSTDVFHTGNLTLSLTL